MALALGEDELRIVAETDMFRDLGRERTAKVLRDATVREYPAGTLLFLQGDESGACYIILDGWVKLFRSTVTGEEAVIGVLATGQSFAEAVALVGRPYPVSAQTVSPARLLRIPAAGLRATMRAEPDICITMLASTLRHLQLLVGEIEQLKAQTGAQRVAEFLLSLTEDASGPVTVDLPYDKTLIAGRLGMKPESLSRAFQRLRAHGVVVDQAQVKITSVGRLYEVTQVERGTVKCDRCPIGAPRRV
ncbi:MAG: cyclic nucleotide-binding domain-containing protein [Alphaproteobacteria bacterium]|nr:cyclic nucleotide-binding domain-containing protein [Alphaproteobacteria bacterium]